MNQEYELSTDARVQLEKEIDELKRKMFSAQQEKDAAVRNKAKEVCTLTESLEPLLEQKKNISQNDSPSEKCDYFV